MSDNIKVVVKVRPLISREIEDKLSYQWRVKNNTLYQIDQNGKDLGPSFTFDKVYDKDTKTSDVYDDIAKPIVQAATAGFNGTIFAYGQTSSGKTYTMTGTDNSPGIIPLAVLNLFEIIRNAPDRDFLVRVSYIEIYNETVKDLLNVEKENIKIHETLQGIKVDATEKVTSSPEEVLEAMKEGEANRQKGATNMNEQSSRSHSIFQITIESREHIEGEKEVGCVNVSQLNLVDLAGSERAGQTGTTGLRFKEGTHINKSLSALALVIKQLSEDPNKYANYRDSKLTRILQNSLGGNAKTSIICAITPAAVEETVSTLQFANRAKAIKNKPEVNAVATDATMIQSLTKQMCKLQAQLESKKNLEEDNFKLQNKIANLQKLILNGFAQRRSMDISGGTRRKLQQPRRITISTIPSTDDEPVVAPVPKYYTPGLKYNPLSISNPSDHALIQVPSKLPSVPEEPVRVVTPPPKRAVNFSEEVIELDSDDDSTREDLETCSPIHKCYGASKTPPCVLRRNAKVAEKNLKDIVELTEREKMYTPSVVEYIEKLEHNMTVITKLEDEIKQLTNQSKEKDLEMEHLMSKIKKSEEDMKTLMSAKIDLQSQCDKFNTKVTDWEVMYETLRNKAKLREEELLSLLEELTVKNKIPENIGKVLSRTLDKEIHFMDLSKDISLVNSDNESSIGNTNDDETELVNDIVADSQTQLSLRNQTIIDLEAKLFAQKEKILTLENLNQDLKEKVTTFQEQLSTVVSENSLLKTRIDTLNTTIKSQKENLEAASSDIDSYNSLIQELQIKVTQKDSLSNISVDDKELENMIANEGHFIANNENMKNIIYSLKMALDMRNKEIVKLKTEREDNILKKIENNTLAEELDTKVTEVSALNTEIDDLKKRINENIAEINKLAHEKNDLKISEHELFGKLASFEDKSTELEKLSREREIYLENLSKENDELKLTIANKNVTEQEITEMNEKLLKQKQVMMEKIADMEKELQEKEDLICSLKSEDTASKENLLKAKAAVRKTQLILGTLSGNMQEMPEIIDNFVEIFSVLNDSMGILEIVANDTVTQKEEAFKDCAALKMVLEEQVSKHNLDISALQEHINNLNELESNRIEERDTLTLKINELSNDLLTIRSEFNTKTTENKTLEENLDQATKTIESCNQQIVALEAEKVKLTQNLVDEKSVVQRLTLKLEDIDNKLKDKISEINIYKERLNNSIEEKNVLLNNILTKITEFTNNFGIENNISKEETSSCGKIHENILLILDKIGNHFSVTISKNIDDDKSNDLLLEAQKEILELTQHSSSLKEQLFQTENENKSLKFEINKIRNYNKRLSNELQEAVETFKGLQIELKLKTDDVTKLEATDNRDHFSNLHHTLNQQVSELKLENESVQNCDSKVNKDLGVSPVTYENVNSYEDDNQEVPIKKQPSDNKSLTVKSSPPSLLTIACNKIIDYVQPNEIDSKTTTVSSNAEVSVRSDQTYVIRCDNCDQLSSKLKAAKEENSRLIEILDKMESANMELIQEHEAIRTELQLLAAPAQELQKKIVHHKTNLSILTATTYAENKSLKSQVKVLQHHHSRFHNLCQRDIPDFKKQLRELLILLKGDSSISDQQNASYKRYSLPDVLDRSNALPNLKNESTLDGDLLMLDTNVTMTTAADNTLATYDQTSLDLTQFYNEPAYQTNEVNQITDQNIQHMEILNHDNQSMYERIYMLREDNEKLRELINNAQSSPIKLNNDVNENMNQSSVNVDIKVPYECVNCKKFNEEIKSLAEDVKELRSKKSEIEQQYNNLMLEIPSTDTLVKQLNNLETDNKSKMQEIATLKNTLSIKNKEIKSLQEEYDTLSTQVMENISEADDLNKELDNLKEINGKLLEKCYRLEMSSKEFRDKEMSLCTECTSKDVLIQTMQKRLANTHTKFNRSLSDSDTSTRYNKICTLQSELHAGREDCKELTEEVATIKSHLDRSNISMDLDNSMGDSNIYTFHNDGSLQSNKCNMPDIPEERPTDIYLMDKKECFNYYVEKTGIENSHVNPNIKIIEIMKTFYENLNIKHNNEVENLTNKLKDYNESQTQFEIQFQNLLEENSLLTTELKKKAEVLSEIKKNISIIDQEIISVNSIDSMQIINKFKENFLKMLDTNLDFTSVKVFESLIDRVVNKHQTDLASIIEQYSKLQEHMESVSTELNTVNENLAHMKSQLSVKETEYNLLKAQKEKIYEISSAVTLDIVKKDKELSETLSKGFKKLFELNILNSENVDLTLPLILNVNLLFECLINEHNNRISPEIVKEKEALALEVNNCKQLLEEKQKEVELLRTRYVKIKENYDTVTEDLVDKEEKLQSLKKLHEDLNDIYESKIKENKTNVSLIEKLSLEIKLLKASIEEKENTIAELEMKINMQNQLNEKDVKITELIETVKGLHDNIAQLKAINEVITKENEEYAAELLKSSVILKQNNIEMDKMTADILILKESVKENSMVIENLNDEAKNLLKQNMDLKAQLEERSRECVRLETNIKTHEKTAEIQTRMIMRLEKQKNEDDITINEKKKQIEELTQKCTELQKECQALQADNKEKDELKSLRNSTEILKARILELETLLETHKSRPSLDAIEDSSRRRRQSLHDSKRLFAEAKHDFEDHNNMEAVFESRSKPDDLFMDVDEDSNRSTPIRLSKGRDSLSLSRTDQSVKDDEHPSRPSSVMATRRRRQSIHDLHRSVIRHTPSPHGLEVSNRIVDESNHSKLSNASCGNDSEVSQLRERLVTCQQELEDLKEKYRELDEECETCAEYLRERDEQCGRLKKERTALQATIADLKEKLQKSNSNLNQEYPRKPTFTHIAVNTDEDWTNLHSVVVDRMSYDAEVEKNKRLTKTIEELRFKKQDLKNTLAKMQKALEKNNGSRELESTKLELQTCKQELVKLREKYDELDEECETCAQYLREKEEQCRRLKEAKACLEAKLQEFEGNLSLTMHSTRKKRHAIHDQNRDSSVDYRDATTETSDDLLSYQVERDGSFRPLSEDMQAKEMKRLKLVVEKLSQQKAMLEQQLVSASAAMHAPHPAMYVATGSAIVQNQQLTDVMKENQKLKKINAKLVNICKKRGKDSNRENEDPGNQG